MATQYTTMQEMLDAVYGAGAFNVAKSDAPILTSTSGFFNNIYGAMAFYNLNTEANVFGAMPKYPWQHSGFRVITALGGSSADGGYTEGSILSDSIKPTVIQIDVKPKEIEHNFIVSKLHDDLATRGNDDVFGSFEQARPVIAAKHAKAINQQLLVDGDTLAGTRMESLDRVTASAAYASAVSWTAGDEDIYGIDRSAQSWADAVVSHASGVDRVFTLDLLDDVLGTLKARGARSNLIITGPDTERRIIALARNSMRWAGSVKEIRAQYTINGVQTEEGINFGDRIASFEYIPIVASADVAKDTLSRIYVLDTTEQEGTGVPRLGLSILRPTEYYEARADQGNGIAANGGYRHRGFFYTSGELVCTALNMQGSIRDLK
jgi:hypothetical protein